MITENTCKTCHQKKPVLGFYKSTRTTSGYRNTCKKCCADQAASRYDKTKDFIGHNQGNLPLPSQKWLKVNFAYNVEGYFIRKVSRGASKVGSIVKGKKEKSGYLRLNINYDALLMHRLIWKWHHGTEPEFIDHKDRIRTNCKIENLREASKSDNARNQSLPINNTSGFFGVRWHEYNGKKGYWKVKITHAGKVNSKNFYDLSMAVKQYNDWALEFHGDFATDKVNSNNKALKEIN